MNIDTKIDQLDLELAMFRARCMSLSKQRNFFETVELQISEDAHNRMLTQLINKVTDYARRYYNLGDLATARKLRDIALANDDSFFVQAAASNALH